MPLLVSRAVHGSKR